MAIKISDITNKSVNVSDGAWGTEFGKLGLQPGECPEFWNADKPDKVEKVAKSYVDAGCQIILSNSFGGSSFRLKEFGAEDRVKELNSKAVEISKKAAGDSALVFASMGPSGKMLAMNEVTEDQLYDAFGEQALAFNEAGADAVVVETMTDAGELKCAVRAVKEKTGLFVVASMSFDAGPETTHTNMGISAAEAVKAVEEAGADAIGANCGTGINNFKNICKAFKKLTELPIWMKGNAGLPELEKGKTVYKMGPEDFASNAMQIVELGANIIGGCCGTSPAHLKALAEAVARR
jgi:5-methyltetrahydrofolate--homocysteine methyltransferase